ncbi:hypothetical protein BN946_scf185014.g10 [Trametes cinnabarina]|uniref:Uncharacterized protein n=1 Tax=Pycnoporus cinnabarinus TaxID=5643 RepID=A0A060SGL1_PYCCI|nr:hypothetical protein BN946_scf185014.g10 [Trametes cinnabarina]
MRSQLMPSQSANHAMQTPVDLGLSLDMAQSPPSDAPLVSEWELWGEELTISLCEVRLEYRPGVPPVMTRPIPPLYHPSAQLADLAFYCPPPTNPIASPSKTDTTARPHTLYLAATFFDIGDYTSLPKSEIVSYAFASRDPKSTSGNSYWVLRDETKRVCNTKVPCFLVPSVARGGFLAGFLDPGGLLPRRKQKSRETVTGIIEVLKLPDLTANEEWDSVPIRSHVDQGNVDVPVSVALSPNEALLTCLSSHLLGSHTSVQVLPRRVSGGLAHITASHLHGDLSRQFVGAIRSRYSPSDIVHALAMPTLPLEVVMNTLYNAFVIMETDSYGLLEMWTGELLGMATEVYKSRAQRLDKILEKDFCASRGQIAHDIVSIAACCGAFDACQDGDAYDLDAVWQLVGLSGWVIDLVEKLFKECILVGDNPAAGSSTTQDKDVPEALPLDNPIFLLLTHPYALSRLHNALVHIKRFRDHVGKLAAKGENSQIAKDVLMDITDCSGLDLQPLGPLLSGILQDSGTCDAHELRRSLASCSPTPALKHHVRKAIDKILASQVIDRARLFIKPSDLVDGVTRLSSTELSSHANKGKDIDVVNKGLLIPRQPGNTCLRDR